MPMVLFTGRLDAFLCEAVFHNEESTNIFPFYPVRKHIFAVVNPIANKSVYGWVPIEELIDRINQRGKYHISREVLQEIVANDKKGRYRFSQDQTKIKACQGHSISWVEPELEYTAPPPVLYHGTTWSAYQDICKSGAINRMGRHAVHLTAVESRAWQSARRRKTRAVVLKIDAEEMHKQGFIFGMSENEVWCTDNIPVQFISSVLGEDGKGGSKPI